MSSDKHSAKITSFRTRTSKLTPAQKRKWEKGWTKFGYDFFVENRQNADVPVAAGEWNINEWVNQVSPLILEIGCGTGSATVQMAAKNPAENIIAVDVYKPGLAYLLGELVDHEVNNVRVVLGDAIELLEQKFPADSLDAIRLFFPDPWPKKRHHKRRIIREENLKIFLDKLKPNGFFHFASDHAEYVEAVLEIVNNFPGFTRVSLENVSLPINTQRPETKFEIKGKTKGHEIVDVLWQKNS